MTYAVVWRVNRGSDYAGRLELASDGVVLTGSRVGWRHAHRELRYDELTALSLERAQARRATQPVLVLETKADDRIEIVSLDGVGTLHELAEQVAGARGKAAA